MKQTNTLHILNGQEMYNHFQNTNFLAPELMIPFNEAMCHGATTSDLFSEEFIALRANVHHVTIEQYREITLKPLQPLFDGQFTHIVLWFDADMFCQINVLTILAWLDQTNHAHSIELHILDGHYEHLHTYTLEANGYADLFKQVLIAKQMPDHIDPNPIKKGVQLYLNYLRPESDIMMYIRQNKDIPEKELLISLLRRFTEYGLGDVQYLELIRQNRGNT